MFLSATLIFLFFLSFPIFLSFLFFNTPTSLFWSPLSPSRSLSISDQTFFLHCNFLFFAPLVFSIPQHPAAPFTLTFLSSHPFSTVVFFPPTYCFITPLFPCLLIPLFPLDSSPFSAISSSQTLIFMSFTSLDSACFLPSSHHSFGLVHFLFLTISLSLTLFFLFQYLFDAPRFLPFSTTSLAPPKHTHFSPAPFPDFPLL